MGKSTNIYNVWRLFEYSVFCLFCFQIITFLQRSFLASKVLVSRKGDRKADRHTDLEFNKSQQRFGDETSGLRMSHKELLYTGDEKEEKRYERKKRMLTRSKRKQDLNRKQKKVHELLNKNYGVQIQTTNYTTFALNESRHGIFPLLITQRNLKKNKKNPLHFSRELFVLRQRWL